MRNLIFLLLLTSSIGYAQCRLHDYGNRSLQKQHFENEDEYALLEGYRHDIKRISGVFDITDFEIFLYNDDDGDDDETNDGNAYASINDNELVQRYGASKQGYMAIGKRLLDKYTNFRVDSINYKPARYFTGMRTPYVFVVAHEAAHLLQFNFLDTEIQQIPDAAPELIELNADFGAGFYFGFFTTHRIRKGGTVLSIMERFREATHEISQLINLWGDTQFYQLNHHGTGSERIHAFMEGYNYFIENELYEKLYNHRKEKLIMKAMKKDLKKRIKQFEKRIRLWEQEQE
ncbi:MAG: hypothetical protein VXW38_12665 [Bacteroidota bacterium]|nr:hypothetical protein [Bacteroidota bacterium]